MVERCLSFRVRRFLLVALVAMLAFVPICQAYGDDFEGGGGSSSSFDNNFGTVWYGPTASGLYVRYGVVANTRYDAAMYCCRGMSFDQSSLTNKQKSKLLKNGDFKSFAQLFNASKPEVTDDWSGDASIIMAWNSARQLYGETYCWNARYTNDQKIKAQEAIEDVLNDDDTPSGGGSSGSGGGATGTVGIVQGINTLIYSGNGSKYDGDTIQVGFVDSTWRTLSSFLSDKKFTYIVKGTTATSDITVLASDDENWSIIYENGAARYIKNENGKTARLSYTRFSIFNKDENDIYVAEGNGNRNSYDVNKNDTRGLNNYGYVSREGSESGGGESGGGDDPEPPIDWPAPPTETPKPPDVPTPGDPTQPTPPDPVDPTPGSPWIPMPNDDIQITGEDFQDLIDALNEHCIHLQDSIQNNIRQLWDLQSDFLGNQFDDLFGLISDNFAWLGNDVISDSFDDLKSYLHELFEWLSEQLNFDVQVEGGQYDDTSVLYWLKQIWAKLPTGINTKPSDPVTNPTGWWDWLTQLLNNLAADLMALGHDKLAGVLETLNELRNKFPFSLPWDVAALLGLLVGVPECPEFDMPCYTVSLNGLQEVGTYHITLEPYETVWEGVKWIETIAFAVYLIMNTGGLMDMVTKTVRPR